MENENATQDGILVKPGQTWIDLDKRTSGRKVKILRVENGFAYIDGPRKTRISIRRMHKHSTGFQLR